VLPFFTQMTSLSAIYRGPAIDGCHLTNALPLCNSMLQRIQGKDNGSDHSPFRNWLRYLWQEPHEVFDIGESQFHPPSRVLSLPDPRTLYMWTVWPKSSEPLRCIRPRPYGLPLSSFKQSHYALGQIVTADPAILRHGEPHESSNVFCLMFAYF